MQIFLYVLATLSVYPLIHLLATIVLHFDGNIVEDEIELREYLEQQYKLDKGKA